MSCFLTLSAFTGDDRDAASKKLALMFRMAPGQAYAILEKICKGQVWQIPREISDQQATIAENYLTGIGFQVDRSGKQEVVAPVSETVSLEDETPIAEAGTETSFESEAEVSVPDKAQPSQKGLTVSFHGTGGELFKIMLINWILTIFTLGIYYFWGKTKIRHYLWEQSSFAGDRFYYHGTGGELFKGALIFGALFSLFNFGIYSTGQIWGMEAQVVVQAAVPFVIISLLPVIMVGAFKYRLSRTAWRGIRFSFRGKRKSALWLYIKGCLLIILTAGLYTPHFIINVQKFWISESYFGNKSFNYDGKGKDIFQAFLLVYLLYFGSIALPILLKLLVPEIEEKVIGTLMMVMGIPLMIAVFWYPVYLARYNWSKTEFAGGRFNYDATTWQWVLLNFANSLIVLFTLGFGIPLAIIRSRQFLADHLAVAGNMQLSQVVQEAQKSSALGEGAADGFDMDIDIGI